MSNRTREPIQLPYVIVYNDDDRYDGWTVSYLNHKITVYQTIEFGFRTRQEATSYLAQLNRLGMYRVMYRPQYDISAPVEIGI